MKYRIYLVSVVLIFCCIILLSVPPQESPDTRLTEDDPIIQSVRDATIIVNNYYSDNNNYIALDYAINEDPESLIRYAVIFYNSAEIDQANLLVNTTAGTGVLNFSGDQYVFEYSNDDGITFHSPNTINISFVEYYEKSIYDFQITYTQLSSADVHFEVKSFVR